MNRLTIEQGCQLTAFTGVLLVPSGVFHEWAEKALGHVIITHEFASREVADELKEYARPLVMKFLPRP